MNKPDHQVVLSAFTCLVSDSLGLSLSQPQVKQHHRCMCAICFHDVPSLHSTDDYSQSHRLDKYVQHLLNDVFLYGMSRFLSGCPVFGFFTSDSH